jgi:glycosyltransferase involved in cell wall biosynthesis
MSRSLSVVIPVYNGSETLERCLTSLSLSEVRPLECIVVDDRSTDSSVEIARRFGVTILSTEGWRGPAVARNIGAKAASGEIILFIDADVCIYPDTLSKIASEFVSTPNLDAVMGSYDRFPSAPNFMSQYRNLLHSFVHQSANREAVTFWAGCGAIRREIFLDFGGFDEKYSAPAIEDIELGYRMANKNRKLILNADIQVQHLKRWSLRSMMRTDFFYRALPWAELAIRSGRMPNDLNLRMSQRISVALVFILGPLAAYLVVTRAGFFLIPLLVTFYLSLSSYWLECSSSHNRLIVSLMAALLAVIGALAFVMHVWWIFPMVLLSWLALFARSRYLEPLSVWHRRTGVVAGGYCLLLMGFVWLYLPRHHLGTVFIALLLTLVFLNLRFYGFLAREKGKMFALAAIPFHLLYFVLSGLAFMWMLILYGFRRHQKRMAADAKDAAANAAIN